MIKENAKMVSVRLVAVGIIVSCCASVGAGMDRGVAPDGIALKTKCPKLLFNPSELELLRDKVNTPALKEYYGEVIKEARGYCTKGSASYVDQAAVDALMPDTLSNKGAHGSVRAFAKWMEAIGFAYQLTGDSFYSDHGIDLLMKTIEQYPVEHSAMSAVFPGGRGDMMRGLAIGYDWLSPAMTNGQKEKFVKVAAGYVELLIKNGQDPNVWWYKFHNFNGVAGGAAGLLALAVNDVCPEKSARWVAECTEIVERWLSHGFDDEGAYLEGISYTGYGLSNALLFIDALKRNQIKDLYAHPHLKKLVNYYVMSLLPGEGVCDALNDSHYVGPGNVPLLLSKVYGDGLNKWLWNVAGTSVPLYRILWSNDVEPVSPAAEEVSLGQLFPDRGLCIWRTGWDPSDVMFSMEAGVFRSVTHDQADEGQFTLYGKGQRWAIDSGYANNREEKGKASTHAHNCVLVDGKGQAFAGAALGNDGMIVEFRDHESFGYALSDCTKGYWVNSAGDRGVDVEFAYRHAIFVKPRDSMPAYAIVLDDLEMRDGASHRFSWQMFTPLNMGIAFRRNTATVRPGVASGGAYAVCPEDSPARGGSVLSFKLEKAGDYLIWARIRGKNEASNSFKVGIDSQPNFDWHFKPSASWTWIRIHVGKEVFKPELDDGAHRLGISVRETEAEIDKVFITSDLDCLPMAEPADTARGIFLEVEGGRITLPMVVKKETAPAVKMQMHFFASEKIELQRKGVVFPEDKKLHHQKISCECTATNPRFVSVLFPVDEGDALPEVKFADRGTFGVLTVKWDGQTDQVKWRYGKLEQPEIRIGTPGLGGL